LSDKPLLGLAGNFKSTFDNTGEVSFGNMAASNIVVTGQGESKSVLMEEFNN